VKTVLQIALGIIAAIGGFVDIGDLVFTAQAGAAFGYELLWAVVVGVVGIIVYSEMCGRVATVTGRPVMTVVRQRLGYSAGLVTMVASLLLNLLTLAAEVGGVALVLQLFFDFNYSTLVLIAVIALMVAVWVLPFNWIERVFGYMGLGLLVYAAAALHLHPNWSSVGNGLAPSLPGESLDLYAYFTVGVIAAALMPYEVYFYSSGAIEEKWTPKDLKLNRLNSMIGFGLGGFLALALIMTAAQVFYPVGVDPEFIGTTLLGANVAFGEAGLILAGIGILFCVGGAAIDTCLSGAYTLAQFLGWEWGKYRRPSTASRFTVTWITLFALGYVIVSTGVDPVMLTEYAVVFSVVALPFTYIPVMLIARDRTYMGEHANGRVANFLGWLYMAIIAIVALAAIPLLFMTNAGSG
jgi:manganese transport protein